MIRLLPRLVLLLLLATSTVSAQPTAAQPSPGVTSAAATEPLATFSRFDVRGSAGGYLTVDEFQQFIADAEAGVKAQSWFAGRGWLAILAIVFVGGLALNLTPCVLPLIPINLAIIGAGARGASKGRGFFLGAAYGGAMAARLWRARRHRHSHRRHVRRDQRVTLVQLRHRRTIRRPGPGDVRRRLGGFLVALEPLPPGSGRAAARSGWPSAWARIAALLAGACVAPVVIQVVVFASERYAQGTTMALALPFFLGLGMALPWPFAGAGISALPKPGAWMVRVKQVMGVFILAMAVYYAHLGYGLVASRSASAGAGGHERALKDGWHTSLVEGLQHAERTGTPVLIDFWATWCKNCFVMDETTLADATIRKALDGYTKIKFQAEDLEARRTTSCCGASAPWGSPLM